jgi:tetratricopeptide (TPR) repeat protein
VRHLPIAGCLLALTAVAAAQDAATLLSRGLEVFDQGNQLYEQRDYKGAAAKYEETIAICKGSGSECTYPQLTYAYFFLANSYDNQFRPAQRGEATNDAMLTKAIDNYRTSANVERDPKIQRLAMEYLVAAYGPDKLNEPSEAVSILRRMIELNPTEPSTYVYLSRIYEEHGEYAQAEQLLITATKKKPREPSVYVMLAAFYNRWGEFDKTMRALFTRAEHEPNNPEAFYTIATYYWEKAYRDFTVREPLKREYTRAGLRAIDKALSLRSDYMEALTYKSLLLRVQASLEKDPARQHRLRTEADGLRDKAIELQRKQREAR